ncbi:hypothetical protein L3Q82_017848, partial [Scortum barcoo]
GAGGTASTQQLQVTLDHSVELVLCNALLALLLFDSVMDILNLWNDDPEEVLLDLGFGCDEPDLSGRIPARFINYQSQAKGINLQVFLEAQKNRLDLENPDVNNRFRQLEVLQQVTTVFSSFVESSSSSALRAHMGKDLPPEAWERRKRMGMLFRRASKKSLSHVHNYNTQDLTTPPVTSPPCDAPEKLQPPSILGDKKVPLNRVRPGLRESMCPLAEEQGVGPDPQSQPQVVSLIAQEAALRPWPLREGHPMKVSTFLHRKKNPGQARESFEMEEASAQGEPALVCEKYRAPVADLQILVFFSKCQSSSTVLGSEHRAHPQATFMKSVPDCLGRDIHTSGPLESHFHAKLINVVLFHISFQIHSFDDCSVTGIHTGGAENVVRGVIRTNSCQSDSSGFLEEPFIPTLSQQASPGPDILKRNGMGDVEDETDTVQTREAAVYISDTESSAGQQVEPEESDFFTDYLSHVLVWVTWCSLVELEEMMWCLQKFRSVLRHMEEQLSEDQAAVYGSLSDQDREKVQDIEELRRAVKQEAGELEMQLNELTHHYDDSLKMKMHRLLDEQALLCSQLRVFLPGVSPAPNRTVATQCCLLPWIPPVDRQSGLVSSWSTWNVDSPRHSPPGSESICEGLGCSPTKTDRLDIVGFIQRVRTSLNDL